MKQNQERSKITQREINQIRSQYVQISISDHEMQINKIKAEIERLRESIKYHDLQIAKRQRES